MNNTKELALTNAKSTKTPTLPTKTLLQGKVYHRHTDVQETWRKFGWIKPVKTQKGNK